MNSADVELLRPHLSSVALAKGEYLLEAGQKVSQSWFIESGIVSIVVATPQGQQTEVGIVGREGMIDLATLHGSDRAVHRCFVQLEGEAYRLPAAILQSAVETSASFRQLMMGYAYSFLAQVSGTASANASYTLEQRLARWLLMCHDRIDGDEVRMTHEFLSLMINVRRAGVTVAIQALEQLGLVIGLRGRITIIDRTGLERFAGDSYGAPEAVLRSLQIAN